VLRRVTASTTAPRVAGESAANLLNSLINHHPSGNYRSTQISLYADTELP
jgi:hypothetical protein